MKMVSLLFQNEGGEKHIVWGIPVNVGTHYKVVDTVTLMECIGCKNASYHIHKIRHSGRPAGRLHETGRIHNVCRNAWRRDSLFDCIFQVIVNVLDLLFAVLVFARRHGNASLVLEKNKSVNMENVLILQRRKYHCKQVYLQEADRAAVAFLILTTVRKSLPIHKDVARHIAKAIYNSHEDTEWVHAAPFVVPVTDD